MRLFPAAAFVAAVLPNNAHAQTNPQPVPGDYTGPLRPQIHYSPPQGFMNDPNGMHRDANGTWHLYYQYNPNATVAGNQHWGHATSEDLYHWINQPIALAPINESSYIFSGSIVVDSNNTSGFFPNQDNGVVAIFTVATYEPVELQSQFIAYSLDGGYSFNFYKGNPVIDVGSNQFRDPYVIRYGDHWAMVISYATEFTIGIFTSPDLKTWTHASNFTNHGLLGLQYECPNLVEVPVDGSDETMYLLQISINPGAPYGGSISQYFLGEFDGYAFTTRDNAIRLSDFAKDAYAGQFFHGLPRGQAVSMNWASNWQYAQTVPTGPLEGWRSAMGVPRSISVREVERVGWVEIARPYDLTPVMGDVLAEHTMSNGSFAVDFTSVESNAVHLSVNVTNIPSANSSGTMNYTFTSPISGEYLQTVAFFGGDAAVAINRGNMRAFSNNIYFTDKFSSAQLMGETWTLEAILDRSVYETFLDDGAQASTSAVYSNEPLTLMTFGVSGLPAGNMTVSARLTALKSTWSEYENEQGTVVGNVTVAGSGHSSMHRRHPRMDYNAGLLS